MEKFLIQKFFKEVGFIFQFQDLMQNKVFDFKLIKLQCCGQ